MEELGLKGDWVGLDREEERWRNSWNGVVGRERNEVAGKEMAYKRAGGWGER